MPAHWRRGQWAWPNPTIIQYSKRDAAVPTGWHQIMTKSSPGLDCSVYQFWLLTQPKLHIRISPTTPLFYASLHHLSDCQVQTSNLSCLVVKTAEYFGFVLMTHHSMESWKVCFGCTWLNFYPPQTH